MTVPPPDWLNVIRSPPGSTVLIVVSDETVTAVPRALARLILPAVESAAMEAAAMFSAVVLPMPDVALRSTVPAVIVPAPLMAPADVRVTVSPVAVVVPLRTMLPLAVIERAPLIAD